MFNDTRNQPRKFFSTLRGDFEKSKTVKVTVAEDNEGFIFKQKAKPKSKAKSKAKPKTEPATAGEDG